MTLWLIFAAMGLVAAGLLAWALLRAGAVTGERSEYDLQVFRAQLSELDREAELGLVSDEDAAAARLEIERRMLAADAARGRGPSGRLGRSGRIAAVGISLAVPVAAIAVYLELGAPGVPSVPHSEPATVAQTQGPDAHAGAGESGSGVPDVAAMVSRLEQRLADNPDDLEGWAMLGRSYIVLNRPEDALKALDHAVALDDTLPVLHSARGEALVMAADGIVTPKAREAFGRALALDPEDARARFYMAMGRAQEGDTRGAFDDLVALMKAGGPQAPWYEASISRPPRWPASSASTPPPSCPPRRPRRWPRGTAARRRTRPPRPSAWRRNWRTTRRTTRGGSGWRSCVPGWATGPARAMRSTAAPRPSRVRPSCSSSFSRRPPRSG